MSVITFWSDKKGETAKTLSMVAVATHMAVEHNFKILILSTAYNDDTIESCFWKKNYNNTLKEITGGKNDIEMGVDGLARLALSNKLSPDAISNYTKIVFSGNRLEVLTGSKTKVYQEYEKVKEAYKAILQEANKYYDFVFVDLNKGLDEKYIEDILKMSDLVLVNISQRVKMIEQFQKLKEENEIFKKDNVMLLIGKYDKHSKYNAKNIERTLKYKERVIVVPYNTLYFDSCNDGDVVDFFLKIRKLNSIDVNTMFVQEIENTTSSIIDRIEYLKNNY